MARYSGNGSYYRLLTRTYEIKTSTADITGSVMPTPISLNFSGYLNYATGNPGARTTSGYEWMSGIHTNNFGRRLIIDTKSINTQDNIYKGRGNSVHCVAKLATDSICPKGWEMARYSGNGSYNLMLITTYGFKNSSTSLLNQTGADNGIKKPPFSFNRGGMYSYDTGEHRDYSSHGYYWTPSIASEENSRRFYHHSQYFHAGGGASLEKGSGSSLRCVAKPPLLSAEQSA